MKIESTIRSYILENYLFSDDQSELANDDSFLEMGIIDSTGVLEIILFLEETFSIKIADHELLPENLDSVTNIVHFINKKKELTKVISLDTQANNQSSAIAYD